MMLKTIAITALGLITCGLATGLRAEECVIDFETAVIGKPMLSYTEKDVIFELAHEPQKSKAKGRVTFFPHLGDDHIGILNAMADEAIPVQVKLPRPANKVELRLWGSTTSAAVVEALDREGNLLTKHEREQVPVRKTPEEAVPYFTITIESPGITSLRISGSQPGGYVAIDELRVFFEENE